MRKVQVVSGAITHQCGRNNQGKTRMVEKIEKAKVDKYRVEKRKKKEKGIGQDESSKPTEEEARAGEAEEILEKLERRERKEYPQRSSSSSSSREPHEAVRDEHSNKRKNEDGEKEEHDTKVSWIRRKSKRQDQTRWFVSGR